MNADIHTGKIERGNIHTCTLKRDSISMMHLF